MTLLAVENLHVEAAGAAILKGLSLTVPAGEVHALMGPNGSGKSTFANVLAGSPDYTVTSGSIAVDGESVLGLSPEARAHRGLFLAFQYPLEIAGVSNMEFLKAAADAHAKAAGREPPAAVEFLARVRGAAAQLGLGADFLRRGVNEGFSGGEKKRNEILQMLLLRPRLAVLDETDSGLDIDALKVVAAGINAFRGSDNAVLLVTHYQRVLDHVVPDRVHVLADGGIVRSGDSSLVETLEAKGYGWLDD